MLIFSDFKLLSEKMEDNLKYINFSLDKCPSDHYICGVQLFTTNKMSTIMRKITDRQKDILSFIQQFRDEVGYPYLCLPLLSIFFPKKCSNSKNDHTMSRQKGNFRFIFTKFLKIILSKT